MDFSQKNLLSWQNLDLVKKYTQFTNLQEPEKVILELLRSELKNMRMLDIGIGAGRTTLHFAEIVGEYIGVDISEAMISDCKAKFNNPDKKLDFRVCDVRNMQIFEDKYFDFVLFSWNGIDALDNEDRLKALSEIKRICKNNAFFAFSSHNLYNIRSRFSYNFSWSGLFRLFLLKLLIIKLINPSVEELEKMDYALVKDGSHRFRFAWYYIKPEAQVKQLREIGFRNMKVFSVDGSEVDVKSKTESLKSNTSFYYLCNL